MTSLPPPRTDWPGPSERVSGSPLDILESLAAEYGDFVRYSTNFGDTYFVNTPEAVREVLYDPDTHPRTDVMRPLLGEGLIQSEGPYWHSQRRVYQPRFHPHTMAGYLAIMVEEMRGMLARWDAEYADGADIVAGDEMMRLSLPIAARAMIGGNFPEEVQVDLCRATNDIVAFLGSLGNPMSTTISPKTARGMRESLAFMNETVMRVLELRKLAGTGQDDLMSLLMGAVDPRNGESLTDLQLRDEIVTVLVGGHETSGTLLTWLWYLVGKHPEVEARLFEEWDRVLGERDPEIEDLGGLAYTRMVVQETLRLYPPVWVLSRKIVEDFPVGGRTMPKGSFSIVSAWTLHRHPAVWEEPDAFRPERFEPEATKKRHRNAWFPFGVGPHTCVGQHFALMEATTVLPMVARRWRVVPTAECEPVPLVTLRASGGVPARLERRTR